ncbi:lytic transglycosylase [Pseudomonas putida CSV86]|uniref:Lytic transglycosylase n=1 Tax=Pseudomonas bharatica CSV86 TaxID=1005395 RepID=A0A7K4EER9_9PSED|nr:lytic transglycosylase [Pseudomonas bharatica]NNJ16156.1 lytic transglycosylase [Pseudomonas bharatica CSV86]
MDLPVYYCKSWFRMKKIAIEPMGEALAHSRHLSGESYTALVGSDSAPSCFIEVFLDKGMVGVGFLDEKCREYLTYQFQVIDVNGLFLTMATHREFEGGGDKVVGGSSYIFNENGELIVRREKFNPHEVEEARSSFDPSQNYEKIPKFGCYSDVIRADR